MCKQNLVLDNPQELVYHKPNQTKLKKNKVSLENIDKGNIMLLSKKMLTTNNYVK